MTLNEDPLGPLSPDFATQFVRDVRRPPCQLYLISPLDVTGTFPDRLGRALDAGPVAAFQFRVKAPRVNSRLLIGSWVRIRITYSQRAGGGDGGDAD